MGSRQLLLIVILFLQFRLTSRIFYRILYGKPSTKSTGKSTMPKIRTAPLEQRRVNLQKSIIESGKTASEIAKLVGLTQCRLSQVCHGWYGLPSENVMRKLSELFGRSEAWLFRQSCMTEQKKVEPHAEPKNRRRMSEAEKRLAEYEAKYKD